MTAEHLARAARLEAYVEATKDVPVDWDGCSTWPAQWVADETGIAFEWPDYADEAEGRALIEREGLVNIWERVARQAGMRRLRSEMPVLGDIGVIQTDTRGQVGGIFADGGVFCWRSLNGVRILSPKAYQLEAGPEGPVFRPIILGVWRF